MAQLCYSNSRKYRYRSDDDFFESNQLEETKKLEIVKRYLAKQLNSDLNIEDCLRNRNKFAYSSAQNDESPFEVGGLVSLSDFKSLSNSEGIKGALNRCDLNENEIEFLLNYAVKKNEQIEHTDVHLQKLKLINKKLLLRLRFLAENDIANDQCEIESYPPVPKDHPINFLKQLESHLFPKQVEKTDNEKNNESPQHRKRKRRDYDAFNGKNSSAPIKDYNIESDNDVHRSIVDKKVTYWDVKEGNINPCPNSELNSNDDGKNVNCSHPLMNELHRPKPSKNFFEVIVRKKVITALNFAKPFVWTMDKSKLIPISVIEQNKKDVNVIKQDAIFRNYCSGEPSTTLYVKNLPRLMVPEKLVSIFGNFEEENGSKIEYRILNGRMKGQAFVKFSAISISSLALSICNGYVLDGKPIVIEYGKRK